MKCKTLPWKIKYVPKLRNMEQVCAREHGDMELYSKLALVWIIESKVGL